MSIIIGRTPYLFKVIDTININYPNSIITTNNSVTSNNAVGVYIDRNGSVFPYQADFF